MTLQLDLNKLPIAHFQFGVSKVRFMDAGFPSRSAKLHTPAVRRLWRCSSLGGGSYVHTMLPVR